VQRWRLTQLEAFLSAQADPAAATLFRVLCRLVLCTRLEPEP